MSGSTWEYVLRVMVIEAWPSISDLVTAVAALVGNLGRRS
jgi:hypothetical protein